MASRAISLFAIEPWSECDATEAAARLRERPGLVWLDSSLTHARLGRWSIVSSDPRWRLTAYGDDLVYVGPGGPRRLQGSALHTLAMLIEDEPRVEHDGFPFTGGAIGYLGFELGREVERLPATTDDDVGAPDLAFGWYDAALLWDGLAERGWLVGRPDAITALRERLRATRGVTTEEEPTAGSAGVLRSNVTRQQYLSAVERSRAYIAAGDIYQVNYAQRFSVPVRGEGFDLYRRLRRVSPAPFSAYLDLRDEVTGVEVLSSSPERFLLGSGDYLETRPIKGTRPRGETPDEDDQRAADLRMSRKDLAEHVMIVDLERNDLGRISVPGSVRVPEFASLETFAQVHHMTSTVVGQRRRDVGLEALLRATFPGGSITGAPKIRAIEIIDELEPTVRGVYTGSIGYISSNGKLDLNIAIRTITLADGIAHFHVGGAIVHDSDPENEYVETLDKARGMARALHIVLPDEEPEVVPTARTRGRGSRARS